LRLSTTIRVALAVCVIQLLLLGVAEAKTKKTTVHAATRTSTNAVRTTSSHSKSTSSHVSSATRKASARSSRHSRSTVATKNRSRGQAVPDSDRTREIQMALIREHYLNGDPSGSWDSETRDALTRYQADHGWQTKLVPDSRALIKLGLGPSREGLLNPDTAAISPHELGAENPQPGGASN